MIRHTTHWHAIAVGQRDVQKGRRFLRVLEKHFVKIAEPKQQERVRRNAFPQPLVLLHHRSKRVLHNGILPCQSHWNLNRRAACDFLLEIELNTIANALQRVLNSEGVQKGENLHGINVKRADLGRFDGRRSAEYSPAHPLTVFSKARGVIIDARSDCAQR